MRVEYLENLRGNRRQPVFKTIFHRVLKYRHIHQEDTQVRQNFEKVAKAVDWEVKISAKTTWSLLMQEIQGDLHLLREAHKKEGKECFQVLVKDQEQEEAVRVEAHEFWVDTQRAGDLVARDLGVLNFSCKIKEVIFLEIKHLLTLEGRKTQ